MEDEAMTLKTIPPSVLKLLANQWPADNHGSLPGPARFLYRPDDSPTRVCGGLRHSEVRALVADQVITNDWRGLGDAIAVTAGEHQALCDFLTDVFAAWDRLQARTDMAGTGIAACWVRDLG